MSEAGAQACAAEHTCDAGVWESGATRRLPAGDFTWVHFPRRGYSALVAGTEIANVAPVRPKGWCLRVAGFHWHGAQAGAPQRLAENAETLRWFASSKAAVAAAGELLSAAPFFRHETPQPRAVETEDSSAAPAQASLAF